jgi:hypothetical protein
LGRVDSPESRGCSALFEPRRHFWNSRRIDAGWRPPTLLAVALLIDIVITVSAAMFTSDLTTGAFDRMITESAFGQGEAIVSCRVEPDTYILDKVGPRLFSVRQGSRSSRSFAARTWLMSSEPLESALSLLLLGLGGVSRTRVSAGGNPYLSQPTGRVRRWRSPDRGADKSRLGAAMRRAAALITDRGGVTCHIRIARGRPMIG